MSHYEERLQRDFTAIRRAVQDVGNDILTALGNATHAFLTVDRHQAEDTVLGDPAINRATRDIEHRCHVFVARHLPSAGNLRFISSVLRLAVIMERVGDYAETIARAAIQLSEPSPTTVARDLELMMDQAKTVLDASMSSFNDLDADRGLAAREMAGRFVATYDKVFADLIRVGDKQSRPTNDLFLLLATFNRLERVIHQAKNIAEETVFAVTGQAKDPKTFDIAFVDGVGGTLATLAAAHASKAYPGTGKHTALAHGDSGDLGNGLSAFADEHGLQLNTAELLSFDAARGQLHDFDYIVCLDDSLSGESFDVPFHTLILNWPLLSQGDHPGLSAGYREFVSQMSDLADRLFGAENC